MQIQSTRRESVAKLMTIPKPPPVERVLMRSCLSLLLLICAFGVFWPDSRSSPIQTSSARVTISLEEDNKHATQECIEKYIKPYDWYEVNNKSKYLPDEVEGYKDVEFLGPIELVGPKFKSDSYFPCRFDFHSKNRSLKAIEAQQIRHVLRKPRPDESIEDITSLEYQFNLNQLSPEINPFDPRRRTIIIIPGFLTNDHVRWMHDIKDAWLALEDVNVILVHWSRGNKYYEFAVRNTRIVSRQITILLYYLAQWHDVDFKSVEFRQSIYLVGHSCGSHIASYVGQELGGQVARITGLDPAGPIFDSMENPRHRLSHQDAKLVDIIHTNAGEMSIYMDVPCGLVKKALSMLYRKIGRDRPDSQHVPKEQTEFNCTKATPWFGIAKQIGHIDYYVNGGSVQPGCKDELHICDHNRAVEVYLRTLEYELAARRAYGQDNETIRAGLHRLIGFKSNDYREFRNGANLLLNCPVLVAPDLLRSQREALDQSYKDCTIPIDFLTPVDKLKKELREEYNLRDSFPSLSWSVNDHHLALASPNPKYYFDTLPDIPFVSDTYLLRVHLAQKPIEWQGGCQFFSHINSAGPHYNLYSAIDFVPEFVVPHQVDKFYGIVLPMLNPNDWRVAFPSRRKILDKLNGLSGISCQNCFARLRKLLPNILSLSVNYKARRTQGVLRRSIGCISSIFNKASAYQNDTCSFQYTGIELRPFSRALNSSFSLWFSNNTRGEKGQIPEVRVHSKLVQKAVHPIDSPSKMNLDTQIDRMGLAEVGLN